MGTKGHGASTADKPTVSRAAWLFGWALGLGIIVTGYWFISSLGLGRLMTTALEFATVAVALLSVTWIWRKSAAPPPRDEPDSSSSA